jgi:hypothetical protein
MYALKMGKVARISVLFHPANTVHFHLTYILFWMAEQTAGNSAQTTYGPLILPSNIT